MSRKDIHSHNHSTLGLFKRYFDIGYTLKQLKIWDAPPHESLALTRWWIYSRRNCDAREPTALFVQEEA